MIRGFKVKLHPSIEQKYLLLKAFGTSRWVYNWCLIRQKENFEAGGKFINGYKLRKEITALKKQEEYKWLTEVSAKVSSQAALDLCEAYEKFFRKEAGYPKFKCKKNNSDSFFQREDQFVIKDNKVRIEKIGYIDMAESIIPVGSGIKYYNPRVKYDGIDMWITVGVEVSDKQTENINSEPIGIDLGIKNLAVDSNGKKYKRPSVRKELKRLKRLQRKASRIYLYMKNNNISYKEKSKRLIKLEKQILKTHHRINNILKDNIHKITTAFVKVNPSAIVIEDLNIKGMFRNKYLAEKLKYAKLGEIIRQIKYKCIFNNIKLIIADRWYASSKICSYCGNKKEKLSLSERVFVCEKCNLSIDRDYNAALNLKALAV
jgi:putative transposase